jgi:hypothetical protein
VLLCFEDVSMTSTALRYSVASACLLCVRRGSASGVGCVVVGCVFLDALGVQRIPDPTTAGDFCCRFREEDVECFLNETGLEVWREQPPEFFAFIDGDGTLATTWAECKEGMDISCEGSQPPERKPVLGFVGRSTGDVIQSGGRYPKSRWKRSASRPDQFT